MEYLQSTSVDVRYPLGITFCSFLSSYLDRDAPRGRKGVYLLTMCLGLVLFREGMQRELKLARTLEKVVIEGQDGAQVKVVNVKGRERLMGIKHIKRHSGIKEEQGIISIIDKENPK